MGPAGYRPSSRPESPAEHPNDPREQTALGIVLFAAIASLFANGIAGLLAPGWTGVGTESQVQTWRKWANVTSVSAATLGMAALGSLVVVVALDGRTSVPMRLVATFGAGLVFTFVALAIGHTLEPTQLMVLFAGAFAVLVAGATEALGPPQTRALGVQLATLLLAALLRIGAWAISYASVRNGQPAMAMWAHTLSSASLVCELFAQAFLVLYLILRPGARGTILALLLYGSAFFFSIWALWSTLSTTGGTVRDALQRALSNRVQSNGPMPSWVDPGAVSQEIALLDRAARNALLPLIFAELASLGLGIAALGSITRRTTAVLAAMTLAVLSRGQADTPLRAMELVIAALTGLVLSRRQEEPPSSQGPRS